jgi:hypothetical protein
MKKIVYTSLLFLTALLLFTSCKKEGEPGPQGPEGPAGNPGANSGGGGGGNTSGTVKAYLIDKPIEWRYFTAGGSCWLVQKDWLYEPQDFMYYISNVEHKDLTLTYLELASAAGTFWAPLPYSFQTGSPVRTETYRVMEYLNDESIYRFRVRADLMTVKVPYYKVQSMKVVIIPGTEESLTGRVAQSLQQMSLAEVMEMYKLQEKDFKKLSY